jgi:tetratricopeptide (TPR) repeat protein
METNAIAAVDSETGLACFDPKKSNPGIRRGLGELEELHDADWYVEKGHEAKKAKRFHEALAMYEKALTVDQDNCDALFFAGFCLEACREWAAVIYEIYGKRVDIALKRAMRYFTKLIEIDIRLNTTGYLAAAWVNLGFAHSFFDETEKEEASYWKAIEVNPEDACAWNNLANIANSKYGAEKAIEYYNKSISADGKFSLALYNLGCVHKDLKDEKRALACFIRFLECIDHSDPWDKKRIQVARDYIEIHSPSKIESKD